MSDMNPTRIDARIRARHPLERIRRRGSEESGVVLVLMAFLMTTFLALGALAIDLGSLDQSQSQAQAAADAGALAAAQDLPYEHRGRLKRRHDVRAEELPGRDRECHPRLQQHDQPGEGNSHRGLADLLRAAPGGQQDQLQRQRERRRRGRQRRRRQVRGLLQELGLRQQLDPQPH